MSPTPTTGQRCPGGRSCPNLRRADVLDGWISKVASERDRYRKAIEEHLGRCEDLRAVLPVRAP